MEKNYINKILSSIRSYSELNNSCKKILSNSRKNIDEEKLLEILEDYHRVTEKSINIIDHISDVDINSEKIIIYIRDFFDEEHIYSIPLEFILNREVFSLRINKKFLESSINKSKENIEYYKNLLKESELSLDNSKKELDKINRTLLEIEKNHKN